MAALRVLTSDTAGTPGELVLHVVGEVDVATAGKLREAMRAAMATATGPYVLDCARLSFIDAAGVGSLVWFAGRVERQGAAVGLRNPSPTLLRILSITGLEHRFREAPLSLLA